MYILLLSLFGNNVLSLLEVHMCYPLLEIHKLLDITRCGVICASETTAIYIYVLLFCQMQGFKEKHIKQSQYRLFAVCWQSAKVFVVCLLLAKRTRGTQLCNLATAG